MTTGDCIKRRHPVKKASAQLVALKGYGFRPTRLHPRQNAAPAAEGMPISARTSFSGLSSILRDLRLLCAICVLLLISLPLRADKKSTPAKPLNVHQMAQRVDNHYNQLRSLKAGFSETYEGLGMKRTESGTLFLLKPGRMRWDYSSPPGKLFLLDGKYAWSYTRGDAQVQRISAKKLDDLRSPLRFLLGHTRLEKEVDNLKLAPAPNGRFTLSGQPKGQQNRIHRLTLTVTADGTITGIEIEETDGALTRFIFTNEQPNALVPAGAFRFTPPQGIPVVDALPPV
jgi:outer membrane lipoprotein carrier protein